jgi:ComF family protein
MSNLLLNSIDRILACVYPDICQVCQESSASKAQGYVCQSCRSGVDGVQFIEEPLCRCCGTPFEGEMSSSFECSNCRDHHLHFRSARAAVRMTGLMKKVIHDYKYHNSLWFEPFLSELMLTARQTTLNRECIDYLVPIPLHWKRKWDRSYNQSERLAHLASRSSGIPVATGLLKRVQPTPTQTRLTRIQRMENVRGAFVYNRRTPLAGAAILLIDDVLTTGATASECAKVLMRNGARSVDVWTVARGTLQ